MDQVQGSKYEFGDYSFIKNNQEYYNYTIFHDLIDKYRLWEDVKNFSDIPMNSPRFNNLIMLFQDKYNNMGSYLTRDEYLDIMDSLEMMCDDGWDVFVIEKS